MAIDLGKTTKFGGNADYWMLSNVQYDVRNDSVVYTYLLFLSEADYVSNKVPCDTVVIRDKLSTADMPNNILDIDTFIVATSRDFLGGVVVANP